MNTIVSVLKAEIVRIARKEMKQELLSLKKAASTYRTEIAALKREVKTLRSEIRANSKAIKSAPPKLKVQEEAGAPPKKIRFTPQSLATLRAKLGLSQAEMARLLGASALSVYKWEAGKAHPRAAQLARIASARGLGKKEAAKILAEA